jgi:hypothetical protein
MFSTINSYFRLSRLAVTITFNIIPLHSVVIMLQPPWSRILNFCEVNLLITTAHPWEVSYDALIKLTILITLQRSLHLQSSCINTDYGNS